MIRAKFPAGAAMHAHGRERAPAAHADHPDLGGRGLCCHARVRVQNGGYSRIAPDEGCLCRVARRSHLCRCSAIVASGGHPGRCQRGGGSAAYLLCGASAVSRRMTARLKFIASPPPPRTHTHVSSKRDRIRPPAAARWQRSGLLRHPLPAHVSARAQPATGAGALPGSPGPSPPGTSACPASAAWLSSRRPLPPGPSTCPST
jgi:hypothetical protein